MDLILWRHAEAEEGFPDSARQLTVRGRAQAKQMAIWLRARLPENTEVLVSPTSRTQQTASTLEFDFKTIDTIAPGATVQDILTAADWPNKQGAVIIVGHQPTLGEVIHHLIRDVPTRLKVKKSSVWWIKKDKNDIEPLLKVVIYPDVL
ncbi:MAG TPA: histidine phosphatase family protein [Gammaproteobacteria bacterium]|nr:histidine phosphatase family protein [Gammaproteobacteria bacterium]